ncbi:hypothetical protein XU06_30410 (plasmid) [Rhodococcus erythropolis]|nr:hypothetical protein XU06_30410 [Rhodococcus erythropolis]
MYVLELDRGQHPEGTVPTLAIVEDLEALEHSVGQFDPRFPSLPTQQAQTLGSRMAYREVDRFAVWQEVTVTDVAA